MAGSAELSRVTALSTKGYELLFKGHFVRAAEKFACAAEAAECLVPGTVDCIITAALRRNQVHSLINYAVLPAEKPADANDVLRKAYFDLLPAVMDVMQRRKAAGTLLPGTCRPVEVAWHTATTRHRLLVQGSSKAVVDDQAARRAPYVGLETFMRVAASLGYVLNNDMLRDTTGKQLSGDKAEGRFRKSLLFIAGALDLMTLPRPEYVAWVAGEPEVVRFMRMLSSTVKTLAEDGCNEAQQVYSAWRRVLRSGILRERDVDGGIKVAKQLNSGICSAMAEAIAAGRLRACALASCAARESHEKQYQQCAACRAVVYCCREHQLADWPAHKAACKAQSKANRSADAP